MEYINLVPNRKSGEGKKKKIQNGKQWSKSKIYELLSMACIIYTKTYMHIICVPIHIHVINAGN